MASIEKRTSRDGKTTYRVKVRLKGQPTQTASFERKTDANKWAQDTESAIRDGRHFKTTEAKRHTLAELIERYIKDVLPTKPKSIGKQTALLNWWKDEIGSYSLADVSPALIAETRDKLAAGKTYRGTQRNPATVVRYLAALSVCFTHAVKEWGWIDDNPMRTGHALEVLKELSKVRRIDSNLLFPSKETAPQKPQKPMILRRDWEAALKVAEIQDFKFHDLRHSAASYLAMNGASLAEIAEVLGHKTLAMVKRYAHLSEGHTARVVESMNQKIFG